MGWSCPACDPCHLHTTFPSTEGCAGTGSCCLASAAGPDCTIFVEALDGVQRWACVISLQLCQCCCSQHRIGPAYSWTAISPDNAAKPCIHIRVTLCWQQTLEPLARQCMDCGRALEMHVVAHANSMVHKALPCTAGLVKPAACEAGCGSHTRTFAGLESDGTQQNLPRASGLHGMRDTR